jgi:hypothetical protein
MVEDHAEHLFEFMRWKVPQHSQPHKILIEVKSHVINKNIMSHVCELCVWCERDVQISLCGV